MEIDLLEDVPIGGSVQSIRIRGTNRANPVLLLVQQGPGLPMINEVRRFERLLGLEQMFTVVYWDQRGCGRSLRTPGAAADLTSHAWSTTPWRCSNCCTSAAAAP
jgi:pimeloyl-ACP methyl ester carboxylesterase